MTLSETTLDTFDYRSPSLEDRRCDRPCLIRHRLIWSMPMRVEHSAIPCERSGFKIVCDDCGSLSIKVIDPATAPATTLVRCGRCAAVRGTLAELHELARRSTDVFEF
jgi:hypothetical protein